MSHRWIWRGVSRYTMDVELYDCPDLKLNPFIPTFEQCARCGVSRAAAERFGWTDCAGDLPRFTAQSGESEG